MICVHAEISLSSLPLRSRAVVTTTTLLMHCYVQQRYVRGVRVAHSTNPKLSDAAAPCV